MHSKRNRYSNSINERAAGSCLRRTPSDEMELDYQTAIVGSVQIRDWNGVWNAGAILLEAPSLVPMLRRDA